MELITKKVSKEDISWIYELKKPDRKESFDAHKISKKENKNYWKRKLKYKDFQAWVVFYKGKRAALIRIDKGCISVSTHIKYRRKGIMFTTLSRLDLKGRAEIKSGNTASLNLFKKLGFKEIGRIYEKK